MTKTACGRKTTGMHTATVPQRHGRNVAGFSLLEMLVTVGIVAVLAAVAYPSYQGQVAKARRAEMQGELVRLAQYMERIYTEYGCYNPGALASGALSCSGADTAPSISTGSQYYQVAFPSGQPTDSTHRLRATPNSSGPQNGDGIMEINHLGQKFWDKNNDGDFADAGEDRWTQH